MFAPGSIFRDIVDDDSLAALADFMTNGCLTFSSPPGFRPKSISSRTLQATQRSSVTRATAANRMPVARHTTSSMVGTDSMRLTLSTSARKSSCNSPVELATSFRICQDGLPLGPAE
jgi:hypothetical protein